MRATPVPNLFLVGAAKSATTTLYAQLKTHPDVFMSDNKEPHYLCCDHLAEPVRGPGDEGFERNLIRTLDDYLPLFAAAGSARYVGEASVYYLTFPDTAERIKELSQDARIMMVLRNPVERAFSAYMHTIRDGREELSFPEGLAAEPGRIAGGYQPGWWYRTVGNYSESLRHYLDVFGRERVFIRLFEDFADQTAVMSDLWAFLDLDPVTIDASQQLNASGRPKNRRLYDFFAKPNPARTVLRRLSPAPVRQRVRQRALGALDREAMDAAVRLSLATDFRDDILQLESVLGRSLESWLEPEPSAIT